jgi:hypothetical protein
MIFRLGDASMKLRMLGAIVALCLFALNSPAQQKANDDISKLDFASLQQRAKGGDANAQYYLVGYSSFREFDRDASPSFVGVNPSHE